LQIHFLSKVAMKKKILSKGKIPFKRKKYFLSKGKILFSKL
jgi:hypothetical protein